VWPGSLSYPGRPEVDRSGRHRRSVMRTVATGRRS